MNKSKTKLQSATNERLTRLADTLKNIRLFTENEKNTRSDKVEKKLKHIEDQLHDYQESFSKKLNSLKDTAGTLHRSVEADKKEYEAIAGNDLDELCGFEDRLNAAYETLRNKRKEFENRMVGEIEDYSAFLQQEIAKEHKIMADSTNQLTGVYQSDIKRLSQFLTQDQNEREDGDNKISNYLNSDLKRLDDNLIELKGYGETSEKKIFETIKSSVSEIKAILEDERVKRETTHDHMINLLEEATKNFKRVED